MKRKVKVRLAKPTGRSIQLRYKDPDTGIEVRLNTYTKDDAEAEQMRKEAEAQLVLGIKPTSLRAKAQAFGPHMPWEEFREEYRKSKLAKGDWKERTAGHVESRLDLAERILRPRTLGDVATRDALERLQAKLLAGAESGQKRRPRKGEKQQARPPRPRSKHTVKYHLTTVLTALRWAQERGWINAVPKVAKVRTSKLKAAKGRPITSEEFERMLAKTPKVVGEAAASSWTYLLRGLWDSALRLEEAMNLAWDQPGYIRPEWRKGRLPVLRIPADKQKNATEEEIPLLPWFEKLLLETPEGQRTGWVFDPLRVRPRQGRWAGQEPKRSVDWVGKVISKIGRAAGVIVDPGDLTTGRPPKFASAHDLRRSCADRLEAAGVPERIICRVLRHASWETTRRHYATGNVQREAGMLRDLLAGDGNAKGLQGTPSARHAFGHAEGQHSS